MLRKLEKNYKILGKIGKRFRKFLRIFTLNLGKICRKFVELQNKFPKRLKVKTSEL